MSNLVLTSMPVTRAVCDLLGYRWRTAIEPQVCLSCFFGSLVLIRLGFLISTLGSELGSGMIFHIVFL